MRRIVVAGLLLTAACGGADGSGTTVRTVSGATSFYGVSALFGRSQGTLSGQPFSVMQITIHQVPLWCSPTDAGTPPTTFAAISLAAVKSGTAPVGTGSYTTFVADGTLRDGSIGLYYTFVDDVPGPTLDALSGRLDLSRVDDAAIEGEVDLTLEDGSRIRGEFSATRCTQ